MDRKKIEAAIERTESLPTLPAVRQRLSTALDNPDYTYRDVGRIVGADVIMAARVLAQANESRRSPAPPVTTIPQAVRLVGFDALGVLLRSQSALTTLETRPQVGPPFSLLELWRHAVATALAARAIGAQVGYAEPEELYAAALLHDLGKHALWQLVPDRFDTMVAEARRGHATFYSREVESNEPSHAVVGPPISQTLVVARGCRGGDRLPPHAATGRRALQNRRRGSRRRYARAHPRSRLGRRPLRAADQAHGATHTGARTGVYPAAIDAAGNRVRRHGIAPEPPQDSHPH